MALDMAKYHKLFLEESADHLGEISNALLELEKDAASSESIDVIFRMAHSIKSMAASLGFDSVAEVSHRLEDRMMEVRARGRIAHTEELSLLFKGLEGLEAMIGAVRDTGEPPAADPALMEALSQAAAVPDDGGAGDDAQKKVLS